MTRFRSVDHVQLPMPHGAAARARQFYENVLGLREVRSPALDRPGTLRYSLGWQRLDLSEGLYTGVAPQAHLALQVDDLPALRRRLQHANVRHQDVQQDEVQRVYVEDPFGNRLELIEPDTAEGSVDVARLRLAV